MGGLIRNPQRPSDKAQGCSAPTRAAPPRTAPSPASASSSPAHCITLFLQSTPSPKAHKTQYLLSLTPLSSPSLLLAVPGPHREPPAAPAATETCAPCSKRGHRRCSPRLRLFSFLSLLLTPPSSPCGAPASKRGQPRNQRRGSWKGNLKLPSRG